MPSVQFAITLKLAPARDPAMAKGTTKRMADEVVKLRKVVIQDAQDFYA